MRIKLMQLKAPQGSKKAQCQEKIARTLDAMQSISDEWERIETGIILYGYAQCCADIGYITGDELNDIGEISLGIAHGKGVFAGVIENGEKRNVSE